MAASQGVGSGKIVALGLGALMLLLASFGLRLWWLEQAAPIPALLQDLGDSRGEGAQQAFTARLLQRFPFGSKEDALVDELRKEGFSLRADAPAARREATFDRRGNFSDPCRRGANVRWSADKDRIATITGGYYTYCP